MTDTVKPSWEKWTSLTDEQQKSLYLTPPLPMLTVVVFLPYDDREVVAGSFGTILEIYYKSDPERAVAYEVEFCLGPDLKPIDSTLCSVNREWVRKITDEESALLKRIR